MLSLLKLLGSTSFAQILLIAISPILTRLYSPNIFGEFLIVTSWAYIINSLTLGRMDVVVLTSKTDKEAKNPFSLGIFFISIITLVSIIIISIINFIYKTPNFYLLIPLTVFSLSSYQLLISLFLFKQNFNLVSSNKIKQSFTLCFSQLLGGWIQPSIYTLGIAQSFSLLLTSILTIPAWKSYVNKINPLKLISKYRNYIIYDNLSNFFQVISNNLPPILITYILGGHIGGLYYMAYRILVVPISIFSVSISQFIGASFREGQNNIDTWTKKNNQALQLLILVFCIPFLLVSTYTENLFPLIFGTDWIATGTLIQSFSTWIFLRLIYDSFIIILSLKQKSKIKICIDLFLFTYTLASIFILWKININGLNFLIYLSYLNTILFFIVLFILNYYAGFQYMQNTLLVLVCTLGIALYPLYDTLALTLTLLFGFSITIAILYKIKQRAL